MKEFNDKAKKDTREYMWYSEKQAKLAGVITVETPNGEKFDYTALVTGREEIPVGEFDDFVLVGELKKDPDSVYTRKKPFNELGLSRRKFQPVSLLEKPPRPKPKETNRNTTFKI